METKEDAQRVLGTKVRVAGRPTLLTKWTPTGCHDLSSLDVALYWVLLPGLPPQCFESLEQIGNSLGAYISSEKTKEEMLNGATPVIGVQIPDIVPLQMEVDVAWPTPGGGMEGFTQKLEYRDWMYVCDHCGAKGHCHRAYMKEKKGKESVKLPKEDRKLVPAWQEGEGSTIRQERNKEILAKPAQVREGDNLAQAYQADVKLYSTLFPRIPPVTDRVTFKVCLAPQREVKGATEFWLSQDRQRRHFPVATLDSARLWNKMKAQQDVVAREGIRSILQNVCRGIRPHNLEALVAQTRFAAVSNLSRRDGHFAYFAGWVKAARDELPHEMTWRWLDAGVLWDMAMDGDLNLAVSAAEVVKTMFARRPSMVQRYRASDEERRPSRSRDLQGSLIMRREGGTDQSKRCPE